MSENQTIQRNIRYINNPVVEFVKDNDDIININTQNGAVELYLQNIKNSGLISRPKVLSFNDIGGFAATNNIKITPTGGDTINSLPFFLIDKNFGSVKLSIVNTNEWLVSGSDGSSPVPPNANYVHIQNTPSKIWNVTHNLNKRCSIQVVDSIFREVVAKVVWLNNNQVQVEFNLNFTGYVYCN